MRVCFRLAVHRVRCHVQLLLIAVCRPACGGLRPAAVTIGRAAGTQTTERAGSAIAAAQQQHGVVQQQLQLQKKPLGATAAPIPADDA